ncbi:MAG: autotransporter outer membrane beta-barrel domain-containing protein [Rickettsiaceae bacterium]|nr:autotransporter outer membrane beta-barrel domain-containing protein [Rickettsiaceae bacterium]
MTKKFLLKSALYTSLIFMNANANATGANFPRTEEGRRIGNVLMHMQRRMDPLDYSNFTSTYASNQQLRDELLTDGRITRTNNMNDLINNYTPFFLKETRDYLRRHHSTDHIDGREYTNAEIIEILKSIYVLDDEKYDRIIGNLAEIERRIERNRWDRYDPNGQSDADLMIRNYEQERRIINEWPSNETNASRMRAQQELRNRQNAPNANATNTEDAADNPQTIYYTYTTPQNANNNPTSIYGGPPYRFWHQAQTSRDQEIKKRKDQIHKDNQLRGFGPSHAMSFVRDVVHSRMDEDIQVSGDKMLFSPASGDDDVAAKSNIWFKGVYGIMTQKTSTFSSYYKGSLFGPVVGVDIALDDEHKIGIALGRITSKINTGRDKDYAGTNEQASGTTTATAYSQSSFANGFVWSNTISTGISDIKQKRKIIIDEIERTGLAKYNGYSANIETALGYKINLLNNLVIVPSAGIRYETSETTQYKETGLGQFDSIVSKSTSSQLTGILKIVAKNSTIFMNEYVASPYISATYERRLYQDHNLPVTKYLADYYFISSNVKPIKADKSMKHPKSEYNLGIGCDFSFGNFGASVAYNLHLYKQYSSHQGSVLVRVNL